MAQFYTFHLFAGAGGGLLADALLGHRPIGAIESNPFRIVRLLDRQRDGLLPPFPIWDDVCTYRADNPETAPHIEALRAVRGQLAICGGYPCQGHSTAGTSKGLDDARSGLWYEYARIVRAIRPRFVFVENSPTIISDGGLAVILGQLSTLGYDARWGVLGAAHAGAPHRRERAWILAHATEALATERYQHQRRGDSAAPDSRRWLDDIRGRLSNIAWSDPPQESPTVAPGATCRTPQETRASLQYEAWQAFPDAPLLAHGLPDRVDECEAYGDAQVPRVAALAWRLLEP